MGERKSLRGMRYEFYARCEIDAIENDAIGKEIKILSFENTNLTKGENTSLAMCEGYEE